MFLNEITHFIGGCIQTIDAPYGLVGGLFLMGLLGGFTHCITMCGPFVVAQSGEFKKLSDIALFPYHLGRITTYILLALIIYSMVNMLAFSAPARAFIVAPLLAFAGLLFLVNGYPKLQTIFPWVMKMTLPIPQEYIRHLFSKTTNRFLTGLILGLMPCGMVIGALMAAATAPNMVVVGAAMAAFGVGTMPALIATAWGGHTLKQKFPHKMPAIRAGFMVWSGLWLFAVAGMMVLRG